MVRERVMWAAVSLVLASMAISLWDQALVAALGAGVVALYAAVAAVRGRCLGSACALPPAPKENGNDNP